MKKAWQKTFNNLKQFLPMMIGLIFLFNLLITFVSKEAYSKIFIGQAWLDSVLGAVLGSIFAGHPATSYVLGGEFLKQGISLFAVVAFMLAWVTVGLVQLPVEISFLGKKFAYLRNIFSFFGAIIISLLTVLTLGFL